MASSKMIFTLLATTLLLVVPVLAVCSVTDAADIEIEEASDEKAGFSFGQKPEQNTLTVVVLIILTFILVLILVGCLKLRKKMNGGHY